MNIFEQLDELDKLEKEIKYVNQMIHFHLEIFKNLETGPIFLSRFLKYFKIKTIDLPDYELIWSRMLENSKDPDHKEIILEIKNTKLEDLVDLRIYSLASPD